MKKYSQKQLREFVRLNIAESLDNYNHEQCQEFREKHNLSKEGYSTGIYGINGGLMKDIDTGDIFVITKRTMALDYFF